MVHHSVDCQLYPETVDGVPAQSLKTQATVKIQITFRDCQSCCTNSKHNVAGSHELLHCDEDPVRILIQELEEVHYITNVRTEAQPCVEVVAVAAHKGWNASIHTAEDCIFLDPSTEARICYKERECFTVCPLSPTLEESLNVPRWPTDDVRILAKLGWIWSWLQCAAHGSQNCVFNNDSNSRDS
jgi:hypothetical protein